MRGFSFLLVIDGCGGVKGHVCVHASHQRPIHCFL